MRLFGRAKGEDRSTLANPDPFLIDAFGTTASYSGQRVTVDKALRLAAVFGAVKLISETVGMLPLKVYKDLGEGDREEARTHRCWTMLHDQPNPMQPAHRFWATACAHYLLWGNVFIEKLRGQLGLVEELWLHDPSQVRVEWDPGLRVKQFTQQTATEGKKTWSTEQMLHIVGFSLDGLLGVSPIGTVRESVGTALAREQFEGHFYRRGGMLPGVLKHPARLGVDGKQNLRTSFRQTLAGNEWALLEEGVEAQQLSMPLQDMQFVESKNLSIRDVANIFNLPVSFLNGSSGDSLTYATVESNQIQFAQVTITPIANAFAKAIASDPSIFPQNAWFPEFVIDGIHRGDMKSRVEYYKEMVGIGALEVNEVRAYENLPPLPENAEPARRPLLPPREPPPDESVVQPPGVAPDMTTGQAPRGASSLPKGGR
jgi:HK97 family phage portal protein